VKCKTAYSRGPSAKLSGHLTSGGVSHNEAGGKERGVGARKGKSLVCDTRTLLRCCRHSSGVGEAKRKLKEALVVLAVAILRSGCPTQGQGSCTGSLQYCEISWLWRTSRQAELLASSARPWRCILDCSTHLSELISRSLALQALRYVATKIFPLPNGKQDITI